MTDLRTVRVTAVQATPVLLAAGATAGLHAKCGFEAVGHYSRADVLVRR